MIFTSGVDRRRRVWADPRGPEIVGPKPAAQPAKTADPKLNDDLDDLPWDDRKREPASVGALTGCRDRLRRTLSLIHFDAGP